MAPPEAKPSPGGMQMGQSPVYSAGGPAPAAPVAVLNYVLRFAALALTLVAAIVLGAAKQKVPVGVTADGILVMGTLKAIDASAFKYFVAANVIVGVYSIASLVLSILSRGASGAMALLLTLLDVVMVAFLFSGNGAAAAVSVIAKKGEGAMWPKVCDTINKVCDSMTAAIVLSMIAALAYLVLVVFSVLALHKKAQQY